MERDAMQQLVAWRDNPARKPLIVQGARQVGKTWLINEFGRIHFRDVAYFHLLYDETASSIFNDRLDPTRIMDALSLLSGKRVGTPDTLIFLDEIQTTPRALTALKFFQEEHPEVPVIAAGSLLGVSMHQGVSWPVGKVDYLNIHPLTFREFLQASGEGPMVGALDADDWALISPLQAKFMDYLRRFFFLGGMPEVVQTFLNTGDYTAARNLQLKLLRDYREDFSTHAGSHLAERIRLIWDSIPAQLARENKKFVYSAVRTGARARGYEEAIQWLTDAGLLLRVNRVKAGKLPLSGYTDRDAFKLFVFDTGLLGALSGLDGETVLKENQLFTEFKGALLENFVCQELTANGWEPRYWSAEASSGEVDFVLQLGGKVIPLEVKSSHKQKARSLGAFMKRYDLPLGVRVSPAEIGHGESTLNLPLYGLSRLGSAHETIETKPTI